MTTPDGLGGETRDSTLRRDIEAELEWDPAVPSTNVAVSVTDHTVTLAGTVHTLAHRLAATRAARRVKGVHALIDQIVVVPSGSAGGTDEEIAFAVERLLDASSTVPDGIQATVREGLVALSGSVEHQFQKQAAFKAVRDLHGVTWVQNDIVVRPEVSQHVVHSRIVSALHRNADLDSRDIQVQANGHEVVLTGHTRSLAARNQAEAAAWAAPGVESVRNDIVIRE